MGKEFKELEIRWTWYYTFAIPLNERLGNNNFRVQGQARLYGRTLTQERKKKKQIRI